MTFHLWDKSLPTFWNPLFLDFNVYLSLLKLSYIIIPSICLILLSSFSVSLTAHLICVSSVGAPTPLTPQDSVLSSVGFCFACLVWFNPLLQLYFPNFLSPPSLILLLSRHSHLQLFANEHGLTVNPQPCPEPTVPNQLMNHQSLAYSG